MLFFKWIDKNQQHWAKVMYQKKLYQQFQDQVKFEALPKICRRLQECKQQLHKTMKVANYNKNINPMKNKLHKNNE